MDSDDETLVALEQAFSRTPDHPGLKSHLAYTLAQTGLEHLNGHDFTVAMDRLGRANILFPDNDSIRQNLLVALVRGGEERDRQGRGDEAEIAFERALALAPDHPAVKVVAASHHFRLAVELLLRDDSQAALLRIDRAVAIASDMAEAVPWLERILSMAVGRPCHDPSLIDRVLVHFRTVAHNLDRIDAFIVFLRSLLFDPDGLAGAELLSFCCTVAARELMRSDGYFHYHYGADAIAFLTHALALSAVNVEAHRYLGMCLTRINDYAGAIEHFQMSQTLNPDQLDPFYSNEAGLGLAWHHSGQADQAAQAYQVLLDRFEPYPAAYDYVRVEAARLLAWTLQRPSRAGEEFHFRLAHYAADKRGWDRPSHDGRSGAGKRTVRVLCFGKCNAQAIVPFLHAALADHADLRIIPVWSEDPCRTRNDIARYTGQSDVVIYQDFAILAGSGNRTLITNQTALAAEMDRHPHLVRLSYPYIENPAFWSIFIRTGDQMPVTGKAVRELLESNSDIDDILRAYDAGELDFGFARRIRDVMSSLRFVERATDIRVHDYIHANMTRKRLFLDPNHPSKEIWGEIARQVCAILVDRNVIPAAPDDLAPLYATWSDEVPYEGVGTPIDRYSQSHFEFDWGPAADSAALTAYYHRMLRFAKARLAGLR